MVLNIASSFTPSSLLTPLNLYYHLSWTTKRISSSPTSSSSLYKLPASKSGSPRFALGVLNSLWSSGGPSGMPGF